MRATTKTGAGTAQDRRRGPGARDTSHRGRLLLLAAALLLTWFLAPTAMASDPPLSGTLTEFKVDAAPLALPDFVMLGADGQPVPRSDLDGRLIVLNFWATWCGPCLHEMPSLNALQAHYDPEEVLIVTLSVDRGGARVVNKFYTEQKLDNLGIYLDPKSKAMRALGIRRLPTTLLLDGVERRLGILEGVAEWDSAEARALIDHYRVGKLN